MSDLALASAQNKANIQPLAPITHQECLGCARGLSGAAEEDGGHQTDSVRLQQLRDETC